MRKRLMYNPRPKPVSFAIPAYVDSRIHRPLVGSAFAVLAAIGVAKDAAVKLTYDPRELRGYPPNPLARRLNGRRNAFE